MGTTESILRFPRRDCTWPCDCLEKPHRHDVVRGLKEADGRGNKVPPVGGRKMGNHSHIFALFASNRLAVCRLAVKESRIRG